MRVARPRHGNLIGNFLILGDVAGPGGKADRFFDIVLVHDRVPTLDLLGGAEFFPLPGHRE
jgi:hypothetical protein